MIQQLIMTDKVIEEEPIIRQQIGNKIEALIARPTRKEIVRLPLELYKFCNSIFRRQTQVEKFLLQLFIREFHLKDPKKMIAQAQETKAQDVSLYVKVLVGCKDTVTVYLSQLFLRFFLLGLSVKLGEPWREVIVHKTRGLVKDLQVELVISGGLSFSETMVEELQILAQDFACLQFYEGLRELFAKCDTFHVQQWIQKTLEERRTQFQQKLIAPQGGKPQEKENQTKKVIKKKRVTINVTDTNFSNNDPFSETQSILKHHQPTAESKSQTLLSVSEIANKLRASGGSSSYKSMPKPPRIFVYKSNKKTSSQEETSAEQEPFYQPAPLSPEPIKLTPPYLQNPSTSISKIHQVDSPTSDIKVLCQETPPRTLRRRLQ